MPSTVAAAPCEAGESYKPGALFEGHIRGATVDVRRPFVLSDFKSLSARGVCLHV
jgi:hypothetical protein